MEIPEQFTTKIADIRYRYETVEISECEARMDRDAQIRNLEEDIKVRRGRIRQLKKSPLPTHKTVVFEVRPGQPGYEELAQFDPVKYQGTTLWVNKP